MQESPSRSPKAPPSGDATFYGHRPTMMPPSSRRPSSARPTHQHMRLYKAPHPTIRTMSGAHAASAAAAATADLGSQSLHGGSTHLGGEGKTGYARRRRPAPGARAAPAAVEGPTGTGFRATLERQWSDGSLTDTELQASARSHRSDDMFNSVPDGLVWKNIYSPERSEPRINVGGHRQLLGDFSEPALKNSNHNGLFVSDRQQQPRRVKHFSSLWQFRLRPLLNPVHLLQLVALLCLAGVIYQSHRKVKAHRSRLDRYDEERSHILEQMMWMDKAAKKIHAASVAKNSNQDGLSLEALQKEIALLQEQLEHIQVRVQLNARDRIHDRFGNKPITVTLQLKLMTEEDNQEPHLTEYPVVLELSDDTPHAVNVLLQQIDNKQWDTMVFETIRPGVVQVSSRKATGSPLIEFVEESRSCNTAGSVALHETVVDQVIHVLYLRIYLQDNAVLPRNDICIGRVSEGLDRLHHVPIATEPNQ